MVSLAMVSALFVGAYLPGYVWRTEFTVAPPIHDVSVISVAASPREVTQGQIVNLTVIARNQGNVSESFNVTAFYGNTTISSQEVLNLVAGASRALLFRWNTTSVTPGTYTVGAVASVVPYETNTADNTNIDGSVTVFSKT